MPVRCAVLGCGNVRRKGLFFFALPKNETRAEKWMIFSGVRTFEGKCFRICSIHFAEKDIWKRHPRPLLSPTAIPSIHGPNQCSNANELVTQGEASLQEAMNQTKPNQTTNDVELTTKNKSATTSDPVYNEVLVPLEENASSIGEVNIHQRSSSPVSTQQRLMSPSTSGRTNTSRSPKTTRLLHKVTLSRDMWRSRYNRLKAHRQFQTNSTRTSPNRQFLDESKVLLNKQSHALFMLQITLAKKNKYHRRYTDKIKDLALSIYYHSPRTYRYLKTFLLLPAINTLKTYQNQVPMLPGLNEHVLTALKTASPDLEPKNRLVSILLDEVHLSEEIHYDSKLDQFVGYADDGVSRGSSPAKSALVCMITWINRNRKQVLGYWLLAAKGNKDRMYNIVMRCIEKINDTGLILKAIICDQGPLNLGFIKRLKVTNDRPYFLYNGYKIYIIFDPPHLLKSVRNNLMERDLIYNGKIVSWDVVKDVFHLSQKAKLNIVPKLKQDHFLLSTFSKMKVSFAAQIFSHAMYIAISCYQMMFPGSFNKPTEGTIEFVKDMDNLFDTANSLLYEETITDKYNFAMTVASKHQPFLAAMKVKLQDCKFVTGRRPPCIDGWLITINSLIQLCEDINTNYNIDKLRTRRLCQDALENSFSIVRQQHGCNTKPSPKQFVCGFRQLIISQVAKISEKGNCQADDNVVALKLQDIQKELSQSGPVRNVTPIEVDLDVDALPIDDDNDDVSKFGENSAIYYIAGYLCKKFLKHNNCDKCRTVLVNRNPEVGIQEHQIFTFLKTYEKCSLYHANDAVFEAIRVWERAFNTFAKNHLYINNFTQTLYGIINSGPILQLCSKEHTEIFLKSYLTIRCHWEARFCRRAKGPNKMRAKFSRFTS